MMTVTQTAPLLRWVIAGLILLGILLYFLGPAALRTDEIMSSSWIANGAVELPSARYYRGKIERMADHSFDALGPQIERMARSFARRFIGPRKPGLKLDRPHDGDSRLRHR